MLLLRLLLKLLLRLLLALLLPLLLMLLLRFLALLVLLLRFLLLLRLLELELRPLLRLRLLRELDLRLDLRGERLLDRLLDLLLRRGENRLLIGDLYLLDGARLRGEIDLLRPRGDLDLLGEMDLFLGDLDLLDIDLRRDDLGEIDLPLDDLDLLGDFDLGEGDLLFDGVFLGLPERVPRCGLLDFFLLDSGDRKVFRCEDLLGDLDTGLLSVDVCLALEAFGDLDLLEEELRELDLRFPISTFDFETLTLKSLILSSRVDFGSCFFSGDFSAVTAGIGISSMLVHALRVVSCVVC